MIDKMVAEYALADAIIVPSTYSYNSFLEHGVSADKLYKVALIKEKLTNHIQKVEKKDGEKQAQ